MGFFNIYNEGQQAEEYKARKAKEAEEKEKAEAERKARRYNTDDLRIGMKNDEDYEGAMRTYRAQTVNSNDSDKRMRAMLSPNVSMNKKENIIKSTPRKMDDILMHTDAIQKHMKRHPKQWDGDKYIGPKKESYGIFESVEFLNEDWSSFQKEMDRQNAELKQKQSEMEKTRDDAMRQIHSRHVELHKLLDRVEQQMKNNYETNEADNREFDNRLARMDKALEDLLK